MSVVSREEIDKIVDEDYRSPRMLAHRVAALVEQRLREMVCSRCGETRDKHAEAYGCPIIEHWDGNPNHSPEAEKCGDWITRAQYEADREGR